MMALLYTFEKNSQRDVFKRRIEFLPYLKILLFLSFLFQDSITFGQCPAAPAVTSPVNYCLNSTATQLAATGSNLNWGTEPPVLGSVGGSSVLSGGKHSYIDATIWNNRLTYFTTTKPNTTIISVDYYLPQWQTANGIVLSIFNSSGNVIATSSTVTNLTAGSTTIQITNVFNYTIPVAGNYSIGLSAGSGNIGYNNPVFPITESTGTISMTGSTGTNGANSFNNLQFSVNPGQIAPTPSTTTAGTTNYVVTQTVNGCVSPQATISVIVTSPPSATIFYAGSPFCKSLATAQAVTQSGTTGGTYSASPAGLTINSATGAITPSTSTAGTYTVTYTMAAAGGCSIQTATTPVTVTTLPSATIFYSGSPYCSGAATATVTKTGTGTGTFSSTTGLIIDANSGTVDLNSSTAGTYTVTYTVAASNGCAIYQSGTTIAITPKVQTPVFASGATSSRCQGAGTVTYSATSTNSTGISYSLDAASISGGNAINSSTGVVTYATNWSGTSTITATAAGCSPLTASHTVTISATPFVSATSPIACVGNTGTITASGSVGLAPYTYSLNGGTYQSSGVFSSLALGTYTVSMQSAAGCTASTSVVVSTYPNSTDDQTSAGSNSWVGHIYNGINFQNYIGYFAEGETFSESFGGNATCFPVSSSFGTSSVYTEKFSVRFSMNSTKKGLYVADLGSDDGSKLTIDGNIVYNNWTDQVFNTKPRVLINLTGSSSLNYEYYENNGANQVVFQNLTLVLANILTTNLTQGICQGNSGTAITGDTFGALPSGLSNPQYQWTYSLSSGGARTNITGATSATFTPDPSAAPFNNAGTYYIYRNATVTSANNTGLNPYTVSNESNAALITITATPDASISYADAPFCNSITTAESVTVTGTGGGQFTATSGLSVDGTTGAIIPSVNPIGNYTVTYTVPATGGCSSFTTNTDVYIGSPGSWSGHLNTDWNNAGNWLCGQIPGSATDAIIPKYVSNFPTVISNTAEAKDVIIRSGASLIIEGTIKVAGAILNSGSLNVTQGTLEMNGSSSQNIAGSMFQGKMIKNLVVSNSGDSGLSISSTPDDTLKISGTLSFGAANSKLYTGNNLTLVSDNSGTANVGLVGSGNAINGNVTVERFINTGTANGQHAKSWQFLATPTNGQTVKQSWMENGTTSVNYGTQVTGPGGPAAGFDIYTATPSLKYYDPQTNNWVGITNTNNLIYNPKGYMVFVRGDRTVTAYNQPATVTTLRTTGPLLTGSLPPISVIPGKFQSIGNPYASRVDFTLITRNAGVDNLFYVWDPYLFGAYGLGGYQTLSSANDWKPVPGGTTSYPTGVPCSIIQSGQAFFVHSTQAAGAAQTMNVFAAQSTNVSFTENCKAITGKTVNFARVAGNLSNNNSQFLRVSLFTGTGQTALIADGNSVAFKDNYSNDVDGNDALKLLNSGENFGIKSSGKTLSIEARALPTAADTIFYNMSNMSQRTYQLRFFPENMQSGGLQAFLLDKFLNSSTPLSLTDSSFVNVTVTSNAASAASDRFKVVFRQMNALPVTFVSIKAVQKDKNILVEWSVENESGMQQFEVEKSSDGINFLQIGIIPALNKGAADYNWIDAQPFGGDNYYRIRSVSRDGIINYTKIIRVTIAKITGKISVYPNPINDGSIHLQMTNQPTGIYRIKLLSSSGQMLITGKITHSESKAMETIHAGHLPKGIYQLELVKPDENLELIRILN